MERPRQLITKNRGKKEDWSSVQAYIEKLHVHIIVIKYKLQYFKICDNDS